MTSVHLQTLGCRLNEAELETWAREFRARGIVITPDAACADMVVVNTCAVTQEAVRKSRNLIRRAQRQNPQAKLVVSGCYSSLAEPQTAEELGIDLVVSNHEKDQLVDLTCQAFAVPVMPQAATEPDASSLLARGRQRAFIKVQDGCRYRCTYCVVTLARGAERSRPLAEIIAEIQTLSAEVHEVVLTGVHLGGYGHDLGHTLTDLVQAVLNETTIPRIRLGSVEPWDIPPDFWQLFNNPRLMPHLHLPMQSGSDSVLRRMARRCKTATFTEMINRARQQIADITVTTDIIVGFPGETAAEWQQTLDFVAQIRFAHIHIFSYSARAGTRAAELPAPVSRTVQRTRSAQLHQIATEHRRSVLEQHVGRTYPILIEGQPTQTRTGREWQGYTPNYLRVRLHTTSDVDLANQIVPAHTRQVTPDGAALTAATLSSFRNRHTGG